MKIGALSTYVPAWTRRGVPVTGHDEDVVTMAVAAGRALADVTDAPMKRVVVVTLDPGVLEGAGLAIIGRGIGLPVDAWVELRIGAAATCLDAVLRAAPGTAVIGVDNPARGACIAAAALVTDYGLDVQEAGAALGSLPMRVKHVDGPGTAVYDDRRVEREMGWAPIVAQLAPPEDSDLFLAGVPAADAARLGAVMVTSALPALGAAAALAMLTGLAEEGRSGRIIAVETASGLAANVSGPRVPVARVARPALDEAALPRVPAGAEQTIPFSMPAYARAFEAKVGMLASHCSCGTVEYPPRRHCAVCARVDEVTLEPLARTGEIYTAVTIHTPVPGIPGPYAVAVVSVDDSPVRALAQVTDAPPAAAAIGTRGRFVLRRVAWREGVPDYGYAFVPDFDEVNS